MSKLIYVLEKQKGSMKVYSVEVQELFEDTYNKIRLRPWYITRYKLNVPSLVVKAANPELYNKLDKLIDMVNLFKPRGAVPNKLVDWNEPKSTSILVRRGGKIEIGRRKSYGKSGINVVPISDGDKNGPGGFFSDAKFYCGEDGYEDPVYGGHHYYVPEGTPEYQKWAKWMDKKYNKLTNYAFVENERPKPFDMTKERAKLNNQLESAYAYFERVPSSTIIKDWAYEGLCKMNEGQTFIYDKHGYFIMETAELDERDNGEALFRIKQYLDNSELSKALSVVRKYCN